MSQNLERSIGYAAGQLATPLEDGTSGCTSARHSKAQTDLITKKNIRDRRKAVLFNIVATSVMSISTLLMKVSEMRGNEITLCTGMFGVFLGIIGYIVSSRKGRSFTNRTFFRALIGGTIFGGLFSFLYFVSFDFITMGDSTTVNFFSSFACCLIFESAVLKLKPHFLTIVAGFVGLVGVALICQPEGLLKLEIDARYIFGVALTGVSGLCGALLYINMKKTSSLPYSLLLCLYFPGAVLFSIPAFISIEIQVCPIHLDKRVIGMSGCLLYACVIYFFIMGSQLSLPSVSFVLKLFSIVTSYLLQFFFLPFESVSLYSLFGAISICASISLQTLVMLKYTSPQHK